MNTSTIAILLAAAVSAAPADSPDTVVVCPAEFRAALEPWAAYRRLQGHRLSFVGAEQSAWEIRDAIRRHAESGNLKFVVLVGDASPLATPAERANRVTIPAHRVQAKINIRWGSEPEIATDNWYADLDDDLIPDLAIGRITADSADELSLIVRKILRYESAASAGDWRRRINFVAGVGGFGGLVDSMLEMATKRFLTEGIPAAYETSMTYASWRSPFCPDPRQFRDAALARHNEGCLFWVYIGHGQKTYLDQVHTPLGRHPILDTDDMPKLNAADGSPIAIFLACYTGAYDLPRDCLAEEMLRADGGPVAILCGSRVTMPYAMAVMADGLIREQFSGDCATIGEVFLRAKQNLARSSKDAAADAGTNRKLLDMLAAAFSPNADELDEERREHLSLFNLLGDPLLRVEQPGEVKLRLTGTIDAGEVLRIDGDCDLKGECLVDLVCRRDRTKHDFAPRSTFIPTSAALAAYNQVYQASNDRRWATHRTRLTGGSFRFELPIPEEARGPCHVRLYVHDDRDYALGAADVFIRRPLQAAGPEAR